MSHHDAHHHKHHRDEPHHTTGGHKPKPRIHPALWYGIGVVLVLVAVVVWTLLS